MAQQALTIRRCGGRTRTGQRSLPLLRSGCARRRPHPTPRRHKPRACLGAAAAAAAALCLHPASRANSHLLPPPASRAPPPRRPGPSIATAARRCRAWLAGWLAGSFRATALDPSHTDSAPSKGGGRVPTSPHSEGTNAHTTHLRARRPRENCVGVGVAWCKAWVRQFSLLWTTKCCQEIDNDRGRRRPSRSHPPRIWGAKLGRGAANQNRHPIRMQMQSLLRSLCVFDAQNELGWVFESSQRLKTSLRVRGSNTT